MGEGMGATVQSELVGMIVACWRHARWSSDAEAAMFRGIRRLAEQWEDLLPDVNEAIEVLTVGPNG